jgi:trigger factor
MLINYEDLSPVRKSVEVEIPSDALSAELNRVTADFARQAKLPGFRPGKVPTSVVRNRFAKEISEEVMDRLLARFFQDAIRDKGVEPVGSPQLEHVDTLIEGAPVKFKAVFDVKPQFELREYRGLEVNETKIEVTDNDVETMIERLRESASSYRHETERGAEDGDFIVIEMTVSGEGIETSTDSGHIRLGEETPMGELHEALRGKKAGEQATFEKTYGDDAAREDFRGKTIQHEVTLKEIRVQEKPEVTDEFARSVGAGFESVDDMRQRIAADIRAHRQHEINRAKRNQIGEKLIAAHDLDVPQTLVEEELGRSLQNYARYLASQGVDVEKAEINWMEMRENFRPEAIKRVKRSLILEQVAKKESLIATDVEVDAEIRRASQENQRDFAEVKHRLKHDGEYEPLRLSLSQEKALDFVLREAKTTVI